jgi:hypothetical protein
MAGSQQDEKQEEKWEKEEEKHHEKSWEEKWREDPLSAAIWALILVWAGVALLLGNLDVLEDTRLDGWDLVFAGAGGLLLLEAAIRFIIPAYRRPIIGTLILGLVFLSIGLGEAFSWDLVWPVVVIIIGLAMLLRGLGWRR